MECWRIQIKPMTRMVLRIRILAARSCPERWQPESSLGSMGLALFALWPSARTWDAG